MPEPRTQIQPDTKLESFGTQSQGRHTRKAMAKAQLSLWPRAKFINEQIKLQLAEIEQVGGERTGAMQMSCSPSACSLARSRSHQDHC